MITKLKLDKDRRKILERKDTSKAQVKVFKGTETIGTFDVPEDIGSDPWWTAFTLDAATGVAYSGAKDYNPYIDASAEPAKVDWTLSFDYEGWNKVPEFSLMSSLFVSNVTGLHYIDYTMVNKVKGSEKWDCEAVDWEDSTTGWADCPAGHFLSGFYRTGSKWDWSKNSTFGTKQIDKVWCCKPREVKPVWGECAEVDAFQEVGETKCPDIYDKPTAMVGLFRTDDVHLKGMTKAKCCLLNEEGLIDVTPTDGDAGETGQCGCTEEEFPQFLQKK